MRIARTILSAVPDHKMLPLPSDFAHFSTIHGQHHVGRVMIHALRLIEATGFYDQTIPLFLSVYAHDLCRQHDFVCYTHGKTAANLLATRGTLANNISRLGFSWDHISPVCTAMTMHSQPRELCRNDPDYLLTALLKDADALDRVRTGVNDLDRAYLRFSASVDMVDFAYELHEESKAFPTGRDLFHNLYSTAMSLER